MKLLDIREGNVSRVGVSRGGAGEVIQLFNTLAAQLEAGPVSRLAVPTAAHQLEKLVWALAFHGLIQPAAVCHMM
jgi:hypothetical protein